ncbi:DUF262 domain-containing protein [Salinicoccus bachuensis]|uniref:DUF262 domain-containing HNH endonuclease family protein n=1 Tax=Salinicoccus bachuensis TaxID=3136731 RepID=A0ABZ3CHB8_9STAP
MAENTISSSHKSISELITSTNNTYIVPDFQREFVWGKEEIESLFEDFKEDSSDFTKETKDLTGYLLGNIVLIGNGKEKVVIDGQQRLTTLTLLFKALEIYAKDKVSGDTQYKDQWYNYSANLKKGYSVTSDLGEFLTLRIQHDDSLAFGDFYRRLMRDNYEKDEEPERVSDRNIYTVYQRINELLEEMSELEVIRLINYLSDNVFLIRTLAPNESKAFQLFEVLNDRGRSLEPLDLIKNMFLKILTKDEENESLKQEFLENWSQFNKNLELPAKRDKRKNKLSSSKFLSNFILAYDGENKKKSALFEYFKSKQHSITKEELLNLSKKLKDVSEVYAHIELKEYNYFMKDQTGNHYQLRILFDILGVEQAKAMLMPFYFIKSNEDKIKLVDAINRFIASILFSFTQTNRVEAFIPRMVKKYSEVQRLKEPIDELISFIDDEISIYSNTIREILPTKRLENRNGKTHSKATSLYRFLEAYFCNSVEAIYPTQGKKYSIEHIMSQKLAIEDYNSLGFQDQEEFSQNLNRVGNLTLIYTTDNSSLGNKSFKEKSPHYKNDVNFYITKKLATDLTTEVKNGVDTKLINKINENLPTYYTDGMVNFTKKQIDDRSNVISNILANIIENKV